MCQNSFIAVNYVSYMNLIPPNSAESFQTANKNFLQKLLDFFFSCSVDNSL